VLRSVSTGQFLCKNQRNAKGLLGNEEVGKDLIEQLGPLIDYWQDDNSAEK